MPCCWCSVPLLTPLSIEFCLPGYAHPLQHGTVKYSPDRRESCDSMSGSALIWKNASLSGTCPDVGCRWRVDILKMQQYSHGLTINFYLSPYRSQVQMEPTANDSSWCVTSPGQSWEPSMFFSLVVIRSTAVNLSPARIFLALVGPQPPPTRRENMCYPSYIVIKTDLILPRSTLWPKSCPFYLQSPTTEFITDQIYHQSTLCTCTYISPPPHFEPITFSLMKGERMSNPKGILPSNLH